MSTTFGSVCSGIEAASVAWHPVGWRAAWLAEIEPFPSAVLAHHYPEVPNLGDMTRLPERIASGEIEAPDVFCGGTPCQAFSVAGLRKSLGDARGNLSLTFCEIANAIDTVRLVRGEQPCTVFWENVPGVLSTKDNAFGCFLAGIAGEDDPLQPPGGRWANAGCVFGPARAVAWRILDAQYYGLAQRRRRVFVVASARAGFDPAAVLFEFDGLRRDTAPSREAGKVAPTIPSRSLGGGGLGTDFDCDGGLITGTIEATMGRSRGAGTPFAGLTPVMHAAISPALKARDYKGASSDGDGDGAILVPMLAHSLRGEGFDASEDGTGRGTPLVPVVSHRTHRFTCRACKRSYGIDDYERNPTCPDCGSMDCDDALEDAGPLPFDTTQITSAANRSNPQPGDPCHPLAAGAHPPALAYTTKLHNTQSNQAGKVYAEYSTSLDANSPPPAVFAPVAFHASQDPDVSGDLAAPLGAQSNGMSNGVAVAVGTDTYNGRITGDVAATLGTRSGDGVSSGPSVMQAMQVRRLTPTECERLQGFPDGYTAIPWRKKSASECPDGPRYKALGNSWAVPVVAWIGHRIDAHLRMLDAAAARRAA